jgi:undecaprenyl diphosphate synthase
MKKFIALSAFCGALVIVVVSINFQKITLSAQQITLEQSIDTQTTTIEERQGCPLTHLACIMDGNRRWAKQRGLVPWYGHKEGVEAVRRAVQFCLEKKIPYLSLYTFSVENFKRDPEENRYLFGLMVQEAQKGLEEFKKNGIRLRFIGDRSLFPEQLAPLLENAEKETANNTNLTVIFLFCYGGQQEIFAAVKDIADKVNAGTLSVEQVTPELLNQTIWTGSIPDPDLIIRTGGFSRLSNFLLYKAAYSEFCFLDCLWPDLSFEHLQKAYDDFLECKRNFGT